MSLPRYKVVMLATSLAVSLSIVGCSSNPKKKDVVDLGPKSTEQAYYQKASKALDRKQYTEAAEALEAIETYYPTGQYTQKAQMDLIYTRFQQKDYLATVALADRFIRLYPNHPQADYAYYVRGVANMEQNYDGLLRYTSLKQAHRDTSYLTNAYQNFVDFIRRFPSSQYAVDAAQRMKHIQNELAESEINVARFNVERKAWLAAAERAQWVFEHYPQTPQIPEAVATLAYAYDKLGTKDLATKYYSILKLNYPHLINNKGEVNLRAARKEASLLNRVTLGILGRESRTLGSEQIDDAHVEQTESRSWLNRLSLGVLDRPEVTDTAARAEPIIVPNTAAPAPETPAANNEQSLPENLIQERTPKISLGLPDQPGAQQK